MAYRSSRGLDTAIVRIFNSYGPRMRDDDSRAIPTFISQALAGRPITVAGDGSQTRSVCYVDDTVNGILAVAGSTLAGPVNVGSPDEMPVLEIARRIVAACGSPSPIEFTELPKDDPLVRRPDTSLIERELGWHAEVSWADGISRTIDWFVARRAAGSSMVRTTKDSRSLTCPLAKKRFSA